MQIEDIEGPWWNQGIVQVHSSKLELVYDALYTGFLGFWSLHLLRSNRRISGVY